MSPSRECKTSAACLLHKHFYYLFSIKTLGILDFRWYFKIEHGRVKVGQKLLLKNGMCPCLKCAHTRDKKNVHLLFEEILYLVAMMEVQMCILISQ